MSFSTLSTQGLGISSPYEFKRTHTLQMILTLTSITHGQYPGLEVVMQDDLLSWTMVFRKQLLCVGGALGWEEGAWQGPLCNPWPSL